MRISEILTPNINNRLPLPLAEARVAAGFPSPADGYLTSQLDLNQHLIQHPAATFFVRVNGDSMLDAGIHHGDMLVVDRSLQPKNTNVIIAVINGELLVKRLKQENGRLFVVPENKNFPTIEIHEGSNFEVWGVVTYVIHAP
jgi:DNA polymerase V